jgi:cytochrome c oxidase cbb3-type subunit III
MRTAFLLTFCVVFARAQDTIAKLTPADIAVGKKLYEGHCALCHGQTGAGGRGPSLAQPRLRRAPDNQRLAEVIRNGIPGSEMPGAWQLHDHEVWKVAGYVRSLGAVPIENIRGDPARGRALYESKGGCASCHIVRGVGGTLGPELTEIGSRRNAAYLREALVDPGATIPDGYLVVMVTTPGGSALRGMRVNEDTFTIQLRDSANRIYSFRKSELGSMEKQFHLSLMPSYLNSFSPAELDDVVAYLTSLRGDL